MGRGATTTVELIEHAAARLARAGCVAAGAEAAELVYAASDPATLEGWLERREHGEPLAWLTGRLTFAGHTLAIEPGVYVPRPQSEELARRAAALVPVGGRAVDLCTGCGAVAVHLQAAGAATVVGVDLDERAARCARRNGVTTVVGDLAAPLRGAAGVDVVTAVAPYVPHQGLALLPADVQRHEPRRALDGGADGLDVVRRVVVAAAGLLRRGGWVLVELGGEQDLALASHLAATGFDAVTPWCDEEGDLRGLSARRA